MKDLIFIWSGTVVSFAAEASPVVNTVTATATLFYTVLRIMEFLKSRKDENQKPDL